jgi:hypothetical protein
MTGIVPTVFRFPGTLAHGASPGAVAGSFNGWDPAGASARQDARRGLDDYHVSCPGPRRVPLRRRWSLLAGFHSTMVGFGTGGVRVFGSLRPPDDNGPSAPIRAQDAEDLVQETCLRVAVIALLPDWI